jgi:serine/threonine protein kinase
MEYCEHGDLKKYLADNNNVLPENQVREIISQVLAGLAMMHEAGFANRDVKPAVSRRPYAPPPHIVDALFRTF